LLSALAGDESSKADKLLNLFEECTTTKLLIEKITELAFLNNQKEVFKIEGGNPAFGLRYLVSGSEAEIKWTEAKRIFDKVTEAEQKGHVVMKDTTTGEEIVVEDINTFNNPELTDLREDGERYYFTYKRIYVNNDQGMKLEFPEFNNGTINNKNQMLSSELRMSPENIVIELEKLRSMSKVIDINKNKAESLIAQLDNSDKNNNPTIS